MILGIGTDMVEINRISRLIARRGTTAARRILAASELSDYLASPDPARFLAKRFAVKEAFSKALGTGLRAPVLLTSIAVAHDVHGKPELSLSDDLQRFLATRAVTRHHVSISDERLYALAFVVLEGESAAPLQEKTQ